MASNKNTIYKIIETNNFFNKCHKINKKNNNKINDNEIINLINHLGIDKSYSYPNDIIIHNIISNIFTSRNEEYLKIIDYIIDKFEKNRNENDIIEIKYTLMFIMQKISLYDKILNNNSKNRYTKLQERINKFLLDLEKNKSKKGEEIEKKIEKEKIAEIKKNEEESNKILKEEQKQLEEKQLEEEQSNQELEKEINDLNYNNTNQTVLIINNKKQINQKQKLQEIRELQRKIQELRELQRKKEELRETQKILEKIKIKNFEKNKKQLFEQENIVNEENPLNTSISTLPSSINSLLSPESPHQIQIKNESDKEGILNYKGTTDALRNILKRAYKKNKINKQKQKINSIKPELNKSQHQELYDVLRLKQPDKRSFTNLKINNINNNINNSHQKKRVKESNTSISTLPSSINSLLSPESSIEPIISSKKEMSLNNKYIINSNEFNKEINKQIKKEKKLKEEKKKEENIKKRKRSLSKINNKKFSYKSIV